MGLEGVGWGEGSQGVEGQGERGAEGEGWALGVLGKGGG